jgi:predicted PurR-regulated permease PerM
MAPLGKTGSSLWVVLLTLLNGVALFFLLKPFNTLLTVAVLALLLTYIMWVPVHALEWVFTALLQGLCQWGPMRRLAPTLWQQAAEAAAPPVFKRYVQQSLRLCAITLVYWVGLFLLFFALSKLIPNMQGQLQELLTALPEHLKALNQLIVGYFRRFPALAQALPQWQNPLSAQNPWVQKALAQASQQFGHWLGNGVSLAPSWLLSGAERSLWAVALLVSVFYALLDGPFLLEHVAHVLPARTTAWLKPSLQLAHTILLAFVKGQVLLGLLTGAYMFLVFTLFDVKYALLLSVWFALAEFIPVVGTWIGFAPAQVVMVLSGNWSVWLSVTACSYLFQTVKDNVLQPHVVGSVLGLHPLLIMAALLLGAKLGGFIGLVLAMPLLAWCVALWRFWVLKDPALTPIASEGLPHAAP